jgi:hypothetical protein
MNRFLERNRAALAVVGLAAVSALTLPVGAIEVLDIFEDGDDHGWKHYTIPGGVNGAAWDPGPPVYRLWVDAPSIPANTIVAYANGYWSAKVVRETENSTTAVTMRGDPDGWSTYGFVWSPATGLLISRYVGPHNALYLCTDPTFVQEVGTEYILEAGAFGDRLELRMWPVGEERPVVPQCQATDYWFPSGVNGVGAQAFATGDLSSTFDDVCFTPACPADATGDGIVDVNDFLLVLAAWDTADLAADINDDGIVDVSDFLLLLAAWGPCAY